MKPAQSGVLKVNPTHNCEFRKNGRHTFVPTISVKGKVKVSSIE